SVPADMRLKARKLARLKIDEARFQARAKATRMTPKKAAKLSSEQLAAAQERARARLKWQQQEEAGGAPLMDMPNTQVGGPNSYYSAETPENKARFTPRKGYGLVDMEHNLQEGPRGQQIELFAVPPDAEGDIPSDAIDHWMTVVKPPIPVDPPSKYIPVTTRPDFLIHQFSDVNYVEGDSMAQAFSGLRGMGEDIVGGNFDTNNQMVPITEADPVTREPISAPIATPVTNSETVVEVMKPGGSSIVPIVGVGVLAYLLLGNKGKKSSKKKR
ncbi:MAG: hypothetical protein ABIG68_10725, partial [Acidobacteriota bacterium]